MNIGWRDTRCMLAVEDRDLRGEVAASTATEEAVVTIMQRLYPTHGGLPSLNN